MNNLKKKIIKFLAPELDLEPKPEPAPFTPATLEEFVGVLARTSTSIISSRQRHIIANAMSFDSKRVEDIMTPRAEIYLVHANDFLGPLMLDKLHKSGMECFPVVDGREKIVGLLHTSAFNSLEIKKTDKAIKYIKKEVFYLKNNYTLEQAMAAFVRTKSHFFVVINARQEPVGILTFEDFVHFLFGRKPVDEFEKDLDAVEVSKRQ